MENKIESLYLHFPFCKHLCNYCDFFKKVPVDKSSELSDFHLYLENAFIEHSKLMEKHGYSWSNLRTLYIGGGTPSLWGIEGRDFLKKIFETHQIKLSNDCEFTMEVNPGSWTRDVLVAWEELGVNRYSLGVQSFNSEVIKILDRVHTIQDVFQLLTYFKERDLNYSMDFMLGLPQSGELNRDIIGELTEAISYNPKHFSVYILTVKNNYKYYNKLPNEEWIEKEFLDTAHFLKSHGFVHYEVSNFAKTGFESRHNLRYWQSKTVAAIGPSATGYLAESKIRYKWKTKDSAMELEFLSDEEEKLERIYLSLRAQGISLDSVLFKDIPIKDIAENWVKNHTAIIDSQKWISLTSQGFLLLDSLMNDIFIAQEKNQKT